MTDQFASLFAADKDLRPIILETLDQNGLAGFKQAFSNLLREYSKGLQLIAKAPSEQVAALIAGQHTRFIAKETMMRSGYLDNVKLFPRNSKDDKTSGKAAVLDRYLHDKDKNLEHDDFELIGKSSKVEQAPKRILEENLPLQRDPPPKIQGDDYWFDGKQADKEKEEIEDNVKAYVNIQRLKQFLTLNPPFTKLIDDLRQHLQPRLRTPTIDFEDPEPGPLIKLKQIAAELHLADTYPFIAVSELLRDEERLDWIFVKDLQVGVEDNLDFYLSALETFKTINPALYTTSARDQLTRIYENIQSKCNEGLDHVRYAFIEFGPFPD